MVVAASAWFDPQRIPQDLVTGVIVTVIGLLILFAVKPRLRIDPEPYQPTSAEKGKARYGFKVTNSGLLPVIEIKARLFKVDTITTPPTRDPVDLKTDELFQLRGKWGPRRRRLRTYGSPSSFRFLTKETELPPELNSHEYLLFQVYGKHGFTNFGRVALERWIRQDGQLQRWDGRENPWDPDREPPEAAGADK